MKEHLSLNKFAFIKKVVPIFVFIIGLIPILFHIIFFKSNIDYLLITIQTVFSILSPIILYLLLLNKSEVYLENNKLYAKNYSHLIEISKENISKIQTYYQLTSSKIIVITLSKSTSLGGEIVFFPKHNIINPFSKPEAFYRIKAWSESI